MMSVPGSGGGFQPTNMLNERMNILNSYLQDLLLIPTIKESNQLKEFLKIDKNLPEYYNGQISKIS